jgi:hypothetical protein
MKLFKWYDEDGEHPGFAYEELDSDHYNCIYFRPYEKRWSKTATPLTVLGDEITRPALQTRDYRQLFKDLFSWKW